MRLQGGRWPKGVKKRRVRRPEASLGSGWWLAGGLLWALTAAGCALLFPSPSVAVAGVELVSLGLQGGRALLYRDGTHRRGGGLLGVGVEARGAVGGGVGEGGWAVLSEGSHGERVTLPGRETTRVGVPVPFRYDALGAALRAFLARGEIPYRLTGSARVRGAGMTFSLPIRSEGILKP